MWMLRALKIDYSHGVNYGTEESEVKSPGIIFIKSFTYIISNNPITKFEESNLDALISFVANQSKAKTKVF